MRTLRTWQLPLRLLGTVLAVTAGGAATGLQPDVLVQASPLLVAAAGFGWWAAPPVDGRPVLGSTRRYYRLSANRNTALATLCVLLAALGSPPPALAAAVTVLLLGYLLLLDARSRGRQRRGRLPVFAACSATALVLAAALLPAETSGWARLPAALGVAVAALAVGTALWVRRSPTPSESES